MTRTLALLLILLLGLAPLPAADPPAEPLPVAPRPLEELKFPPGTVVVVPDPREGLGKINGVILSPDEYRRLLDAEQQLAKKLKPDKPQPPSVCRITGKVEQRGTQEVVRLRAQFEFASPAERTTYFLGFRRAAAVAAMLDGKDLPGLDDGPEGFTATVETPGRHSLTLDVELSLQPRGTKAGERGFALNLPGSPITRVDQFEFPAGVETVRLRPLIPLTPLAVPIPVESVKAKDLQKPAGEWPALALKQVEGVEFFWDVPAPQKAAEPLLAADGDVRVQIGEAYVQTTASLLLRSLRGRVAEWKLETPAGAEVSLPGAGAEPGLTVKAANDEKTQWVVRSEGGLESLTIEVQVRQPRQAGKPVSVGPFNVAGAFRQQGTIRILAPNHLRPRVTSLRGDVIRRELGAEASPPAEAKTEFLQAAYGYGQLPPATPSAPLLHIDAEPVRGELRTQVSHRLTLTDAGWQLVTEIKATPIRTEREFIDVEIPPVLQASIEASPPELVEKLEPVDPATNLWRIKLAHPRRVETTVRLEGLYPHGEATPGGRETASLILPRVRQSYDADGRVTVMLPEGFEVNGTLREWDRERLAGPGRPLESQAGQPLALALTTAHSPAVVDLSWVAQSATVPVTSVADVTLEDRRATVRQKLTLPAAPTNRRLVLRAAGPAPVLVRTLGSGSVAAQGERDWVLTLPATTGRDTVVEIAYSQQLAPGAGRVEVGLLWPVTAGRSEMRAHIWSRIGGVPHQAVGGPWEELPAEPVPDRESWPTLSLLAGATPVPLALELSDTPALAPPGVIAERVLVRVNGMEAGRQHFEARFRLHRLTSASVEVEFPVPVAVLEGLEVFLGDKRLDQVVVTDESGGTMSTSTGRFVRVPLPPDGSIFELTLRYALSGERASGGLGRWRMKLAPPRLRGPVFVGAVRWHVAMQDDEFMIPMDDRAVLEQRWGLRRVLPVPVAASARELEEWFHGGPVQEGAAPSIRAGAVLHAVGLEPIQVTPVPRLIWYLVCSLILLGGAGVLILVRATHWVFKTLLILLLVAVSTALFLFPQTSLLALAGAIPGAVALAALLGLMAWQARRSYRRVVFMPSFRRTKSPSTASRPASSQRRRPPSTVDVPPVT